MLAIYRKHARLMVLLLIFSCLLGLTYYVYARPFYSTKARVRIGPVAASLDPVVREHQRRTVLRELTAAPMVERTARRLGLKGSARELHLRNVLHQSIRPATDGGLEIECRSASADLARRWPAALIEEFQSYRQEKHARDLQEIVRGYSDELQEVAAKLGRKIEIKEQHDVVRMMAELQQFEIAPTELARVTARLDRFGQVRIQLENSSLDTAAKLALLNSLNENPALARTPAAPVIQPETGSQSADPVSAEFQRARSGFESEYQALIKQKAELEKVPPASNPGEAARTGQSTESSARISRRPFAEVAAELQSKIKRVEEQWKSPIDLTFERTVETRGQRVSLPPAKLLLFSLLGGAGLALGMPFLLARFDRSMVRPEQVESILGLRVLGSMPRLSLQSGARGLTEAEIASFHPIAATLLALDSTDSPAQVFMVSSALRGEGKTSAVSNLAICFADLGEKTLVIDCDLGRSRIHRRFGYRRSPGLADILRGERRFEEACRATASHDLSILPAGQPVGNGTMLLGSEAFTALIRQLREKFDRILLDTPPVLGFSETSILQKQVDGVVLVIRAGVTPRANVQAAREMLEVNGANFFGAVLNGVDGGVRPNNSPSFHSRSSRPAVGPAHF